MNLPVLAMPMLMISAACFCQNTRMPDSNILSRFWTYVKSQVFRTVTRQHSCGLSDDDDVTVTEALVLRPLLEDRGCITESIHILVPVDRKKQKCFQITTKRVHRSQQFQLHR